jgi:hypothetical protein
MTFRRSFAARGLVVALIIPFAALLWWSITVEGFRGRARPNAYVGAFALSVSILLGITSWKIWTTRVTVGLERIEWKRGWEYGSLDLRDISSLGMGRTPSGNRLGLVERGSGLLHPLPLRSRALYQALSDRFGRLSPEAELDLFG